MNAESRSRVMRSIRKTNTKPERLVRSALHRMGYRFRLHRTDLPGIPDIVLPKHRVAVFVNGCFWHQHTCSLGKRPKSNLSYWIPKLRRNKARDIRNGRMLRAKGWAAVTVWECELRNLVIAEELLRRRLTLLLETLRKIKPVQKRSSRPVREA